MSNGKKDRMAMLDGLSGTPAPLATANSIRTVRFAQGAVDAIRVRELEPDKIDDLRVTDRLYQEDVDDLRVSIETSGQTVPILVRRHPTEQDRYLLVYGGRRLAAIRSSTEVSTVKALITSMDDDAAIEAQVSENTARRDLTFIEKALFAHELSNTGFGNRSKIAEILGVTKSWMSMALAIVDRVSPDLIRTIGPAPDIGRPRWEALAKEVGQTDLRHELMIKWVNKTRSEFARRAKQANEETTTPAMSTELFEALLKLLRAKPISEQEASRVSRRSIAVGDKKAATVVRRGKKVQLELEPGDFADWVESKADYFLEEMHKLWREEQDQTSSK